MRRTTWPARRAYRRRRGLPTGRALTGGAPAPAPPAAPTATCAELDERLRAWKPGVTAWPHEWLAAQRGIEPCIAEGLRAHSAPEDWGAFELYTIAALAHPSPAYVEPLCEMLDDRREINNENIADALFRIADPASVPCLSRAAAWMPEWDDAGQLARKAVWALDRIGTPEAEQAIRELRTGEMSFESKEAVAEAIERFDREREAFDRLAAALPSRRPASPGSVEVMEARLGVRLPPLLRRVYLELADGGWGPPDGVYALADALPVHAALTRWELPRETLPLLPSGATTLTCVDCRSVTGRVFVLDLEAGDPAGPIDDCIVRREGSVDELIRLAIPTENPAARP